MIVWYGAATPQQLGELLITFEEPVRSHTTAIGASCLVNEVLRNYRFEASKVIE